MIHRIREYMKGENAAGYKKLAGSKKA